MRFLTLFILTFMLACQALSQSIISIQAGVSQALFSDSVYYSSPVSPYSIKANPTVTAGIQLLSNNDKIANFGGGIFLKRYSLSSRLERKGAAGIAVRELEHRSSYICLHPTIDICIDKKNRYFHFLFSPSFNFFIGGKENGFYAYDTTMVLYNNTSKNIKRFNLGIGVQLQGRYPINNRLKATATVGYAIGNAIGKHVSRESGMVSFQLGIIRSLNLPKENSGTPEKKSE